MKAKLMKLTTPEGVVVEYVRTVQEFGHQTVHQSLLLSRFTPEQQKAIREGRPI